MTNDIVRRKWSFGFEDELGVVHDDIDEKPFFVGNDEKAIEEGRKRSNDWENKNGEFCFKVIRYSHGIIN